MVVPSYHREGKECSISELQEGDVAYTVEGVVAWGPSDLTKCNSTYGSVSEVLDRSELIAGTKTSQLEGAEKSNR